MGDLRTLERQLERLESFEEPRLDLEQYPTPAPLAARLIHTAGLQGDIEGRTVVDLGAGTGVLSLGAALAGASVVAIERDPRALVVARENERTLASVAGSADGPPRLPVEWVRGDATRPPLPASAAATVVMNPPFGAQDGQAGADRAFLAAASAVAGVSYSIHNAGSLDFLEAFVADNGGRLTDAFEAELDLEHTFDFHESRRAAITAVVVRIEWAGEAPASTRS